MDAEYESELEEEAKDGAKRRKRKLTSILHQKSVKYHKGGQSTMNVFNNNNNVNYDNGPTFVPPLVPDKNTQINEKYDLMQSLEDEVLLPFKPDSESKKGSSVAYSLLMIRSVVTITSRKTF